MYSQANKFFVALSSNTPRPVSSTAILANVPCWSSAATVHFATIKSIFSWSNDAKSFSAFNARATLSSTSLTRTSTGAVFTFVSLVSFFLTAMSFSSM